MKNTTPPPRSQLIPGIVMMLIGGYFLALNLGYGLSFSMWRYLSVPFLIAGVWGLSFPSRHFTRAGGAWAFSVGLYLACGTFGLFGLGWGTAWPIVIVGFGLAIVLSSGGHVCRGHDRDPDRGIHGV